MTGSVRPGGSANRIALVLGAGGFRGPAHIGVLSRLCELRVPLHAIIGCSVGSLVTAYYAAVGLQVEELLEYALGTSAAAVFTHALCVRFNRTWRRLLVRWSGLIRERLELLERHDLRGLHHGVQKIGFLMHDLVRRERIFIATGRERGFALSEAVRASCRLPLFFPPMRKEVDGLERKLVDGALSAPTPVSHAVTGPISATHVIAVDLTGSRRRACHSELGRWQKLLGGRLIVLRPRPGAYRGLKGSEECVLAWYEAGRRAVDSASAQRLSGWMPPGAARQRGHTTDATPSQGLTTPVESGLLWSNDEGIVP